MVREWRDPGQGGRSAVEPVAQGRQSQHIATTSRHRSIGVSAPQRWRRASTIRMNIDYDGGGRQGGTGRSWSGKRWPGPDRHTQSAIFSADETAGVGVDDATPVTTDYKERDNAFTGKILKVTVDVKPIGAAIKAEADSAQRKARAKKALSD